MITAPVRTDKFTMRPTLGDWSPRSVDCSGKDARRRTRDKGEQRGTLTAHEAIAPSRQSDGVRGAIGWGSYTAATVQRGQEQKWSLTLTVQCGSLNADNEAAVFAAYHAHGAPTIPTRNCSGTPYRLMKKSSLGKLNRCGQIRSNCDIKIKTGPTNERCLAYFVAKREHLKRESDAANVAKTWRTEVVDENHISCNL